MKWACPESTLNLSKDGKRPRLLHARGVRETIASPPHPAALCLAHEGLHRTYFGPADRSCSRRCGERRPRVALPACLLEWRPHMTTDIGSQWPTHSDRSRARFAGLAGTIPCPNAGSAQSFCRLSAGVPSWGSLPASRAPGWLLRHDGLDAVRLPSPANRRMGNSPVRLGKRRRSPVVGLGGRSPSTH